jgi:hypothetical protein
MLADTAITIQNRREYIHIGSAKTPVFDGFE